MSTKSIFDAFNRCREWLLPSLEDVTEDELLNALLTGHAQLWEGEGAAVVTECTANPPSFHLYLAGGRLSKVMELLPGGLAWAKVMGCERVTVNGRKGWARVLRKFGFEGDDMLVKAI